MAGNSIGKIFTVTTFGESHGAALGCILDGIPPNLEISEKEIQVELERRRPGLSKYTTKRQEPDEVQILSGVFEGKTTGSSIGLMVKNTDQRPKDYANIKDLFRPGHADYTYHQKFGLRDYRGGGRSSARETVMRVAAGAIAKKYLKQEFGIKIQGYLSQLAHIKPSYIDLSEIEKNKFFFPDPTKIPELEEYMNKLLKEGNSIGAKISIIATNVPVGLGEPVFDKLDADLAHSLMSINAVKGVEIGDGFDVVTQKGTDHRDELTKDKFLSNHSGGILGGISTGQEILAHIALKPTSSLSIKGETITVDGTQTSVITKGRHDPCVGIRAVPIAEAQMAITILDHLLRHRAQNHNVDTNTPKLK